VTLTITLDTLRQMLMDERSGQLPNLVPIVAELEIEWGKRAVWLDERAKVLTNDAASEIEWRYRPRGYETFGE
jgi:hypothetical protein